MDRGAATVFFNVFYSVCLNCGEECAFEDMICAKCANALKRVATRCKTCGHPLSVEAEYCKHCLDREKGIDRYYSDYFFVGIARRMVLNLKYYWRFRGYKQLARLCEAKELHFSQYDAAVYIPCHFLRRLTRFVQPVEIVAGALSERITFAELLERARYTEYQARLTKKERLKNIKNAFKVKGDVKGKRILLTDDIMTTGSTLREAARVLKKAGASQVDVYTLFAGAVR